MTHIANTVATMGGKATGMGTAGKTPGMKTGATGDFAAIVAGLGQSGEEAGLADADGVSFAAGGGAEADAGSDEGKPGEPLVLDLALGAAAQSAVADMVVAAPVQALLPPVPQSVAGKPAEGSPATVRVDGADAAPVRPRSSRAEARGVQAGALAGSPAATEGVSAATMAANVPVAPAAGLGARSETISPATAQKRGRNADSSSHPAGKATATPAANPVKPDLSVASPGEARQGNVSPGEQDSASPVAPPADRGQPFPMSPALLRQIANAAPARIGGASIPSPAASMSATVAETGSIAIPPMTAAMLRQAAGDIVVTTAQAQASTQPAQEATTVIQPVMSALHRSNGTMAEARSGEPIPMVAVPGDPARGNGDTASDHGSGRDSGGATLGSDGLPADSAPTDSLPGGRQFADIIQSLPPIAQSRIGIVGDVSPAVAGPVDVGATLQGQVIDMSVGGQWIDRVAKEITALAEGSGHSRFQLSPPNLGRIQIDVWQGQDGGRVQLLTETDEAARHLRDGQSSLQADARLAALQLNSITIDRSTNNFDTPRDQGSQPQQNPRQHQGSDQGAQGSGMQAGTQGQGGNQQNGQQNAQAGLQSGMQGGNNGDQGKSSPRRDVLNHQADTMNQQGGATGRDGDRLVRYA